MPPVYTPEFCSAIVCCVFETELLLASAATNALIMRDGWEINAMYTVAEELIQLPGIPPADGHMT